MALLLHKTALVNFPMATTVHLYLVTFSGFANLLVERMDGTQGQTYSPKELLFQM